MLASFTGPLDYAVKAPNDVLVGGKKIAGILYETQSDGDKVSSLIFGLGLNISYNIVVYKHHGDIRVYSQPGSTCFQVWLPLNFEDAGPAAAVEPAPFDRSQ